MWNFPQRKNWLGRVTEQVHALNGMDLRIHRGETLGISGGIRLWKEHAGAAADGHAQTEYRCLSARECGRRYADGISGPLSSLDPRLPVWRIITEPVWIQQRRSERERRQLAETLAQQVGIRAEYLDRLPHAFSGGQRQRIAIARALSSIRHHRAG